MPVRPPAHTPAPAAPRAPPQAQEDRPADRLVAAAAQIVAGQGFAAASARTVAATAGISPSAINYNFGNIERLLSQAFAQGAAQTAPWLEAREHEIAALPASPDGAARAFDHVLTAWTRDARPLALLYQEGLAVSAGHGPVAAWTRLWRDFWRRAAATFGLDEIEGRLLHAFFESEALFHLSTWSPALERAAFGEMVDGFARIWLGAPDRIDGGAFLQAERAAGARPYGSVAPAAMRIAEAAAEVVEAKGLAGLTHRAVATQAGLTTGSVTHHFRTIADLVAGAIRGQVAALQTEVEGRPGGPPPNDLLTIPRLFEATREHAVADELSGPIVRRRQLFLAALRRPELSGAAAVIRFSLGGTVRDSLRQLFVVPPEVMPLRAGLLSRLLSAVWFAASGDEDPRATRERVTDAIQDRFIASLQSADSGSTTSP